MIKIFQVILILQLLLNPIVIFASNAEGNGYTLTQSISNVSYQLEGNGYTATQSITPVAGELTGQGYSSAPVNPASPMPPPPSIPSTPTQPASSAAQSITSSGGSYIVDFVNYDNTVQQNAVDIDNKGDRDNKTIDKKNTKREQLEEQLEELLKPLSGTKSEKGFNELYHELGTVIKSGDGVVNTIPAVVKVVGEVFNSKSTFSMLTIAVVVLLFLALGVSVFGYSEFHKIISTFVCLGSLFGYYTTSEIYILPAIAGLIMLIVFLIQKKERVLAPEEKAKI